MRATLLVCLLLAFSPASNTWAGKLSRARNAVRPQKASSAPQSSDAHTDNDDHDSPNASKPSKLAKARREVRQSPKHNHHTSNPPVNDHHRRGSYHRPPRRSHGGGSIGFFSFNRCEPCCPPPIVETHVYHHPEPVYVGEPIVVNPTYTEPVQPTFAESFARQFAPYPYANGCGGLMVSESPEFGKNWSGRVQFELGSDFDGLDRSGASFLLEGVSGFGVDFDWDSYTEDLPGGGHDELHIGEFDLLYRIAETDRALVRVGLGAAWLGDRYDTDFGVNFTLKADFAPSDPIVLSGELDLGTLGDAQHLHAAGTVGVMLNRCEVYGGYDYRRIGDIELEGPMVGLRIWF